MKKFMIFLLMAFLYLGTSQASNEFTPSSSDVGKSLRHWVSPSVGSSAYAKFKPFSSLASDFESAELTDSVVRVHLVGPTHACPGQVITLTAVVENDYLGIESYEFRRNGNYLTTGVDPLYPNRISVTVPDLGGLDSLIQEYDVVITKGCHTFRSPAFYLRVNSIHVQLNDALVCSNSENGMLCADVFSNHAEAPYAYVWYNAETGAVEDTTYVPCKSFSVGKYLVEPHFTWNACVTTSDTAEVKVSNGPADDHITMDDITALSCSGSQVSAHLHGIINADSLGTPNISWSLNGITIPGAHDSLLLFSPIALAGDTTIYILKAEVSYSGFACKTYTKTDTVNFVAQPEISIYGNPIACGDNKADVELYAIANGYIENPSYTWKINGTTVTYTGTLKDTLKLANVTAPDLTASSTPYEITVSVSGENGCSASSAPFALNLNGAPVVHLSSSADTVCNGATVTLTANLADNNIPNLTYEWWYKVGTATTYTKDNTATSAQYTATVADSTSYKVVVKQTDSECQAADSMSVYVFPATPAVKPLVVSLGDTAICNGDQITLSLIDTANTNQYGVTGTYQWLVNGVEVEDAQGSSISISPSTVASDSTVFAITVNATYATTCATMVASKDTSIVLYKQPTVVISGDPIVCNDDTVRLTANIHGLYGTDKYTWRVDGVDSIMNKDFVAQLNQRDYPYNITVVVAPGTACETVSEVYSVLIGNNPTVAIGLSAATVCKDNEVTLTAHLGDYNMPNLTYQWFYKTKTMTDSVAIPTGTSRELTTVVTDTTQYFVTVTQVNSGCTAKGDTTVNVFETAPDAKPTQLLVDQANVCYGAQVTLTAIDTANYKLFGTGSYQWIVNGVTVANATDSIYTFAPATVDNDSINYTVKVRVDYASACAGMFSEKDTLITVHRNPSVVIAGDAIVCDGSALNLTAVVHDTLAGGNIDYLWRVDGVDSTTGANFTATLEQRDYPYELTVVLNKGTACEVVSAPFNVLIGNKATAAVEASDTIVCAGSNVTLTAHLGDYNMPNMTYLWYSKPASAAQFDSIPVGTSLSLTTAVAEETQYFVKITQVNSECVAYSDTIKVKVFEDAAAVKPLVLHASDTAVCYGGQIAYAVIDTANINLYGKGTYQWSVNGVTVPTATDSVFIFSPVAVDNDSTLYNIAATVTYTTPCEVITASIDTIANVFSNLSVVISGDPILCQDSTVNLVATVHDTLAGHKVTYLWRVDGVDSVNQNSNTFSAVLPQRDYPYEITVVVGQEGTACGVVSDVYEVLIGINPTVAIEVSAPILCKGEEATLTAHLGDYNMPNLVYQWYYGKPDYSDTNAIAIGTGRILTVPVEDTTRYYVRVKQVNSECEAWADTVINVFPEDPAVQAIELLASDSTVCIGGQIAFTVQDTANRKQYFGSDTIPGAYRWFVNGFELVTVSGDHFMFSPAAFDLDSTNYIIEVSASYQTECNLMTATAADTVTAYRNPSVVINGDPMICDTTDVHLYAIVNDTLAGLTVDYLWRVDGVDSTSMTSSEFVTSLPARDYPYEITVMINQGTNCEVVSEPFYLYIEDRPQVVITFDYDTVCIGQEVTATAHLGNYNQGNLTYQWFIDGDTVARGTESTFTYTIDKPAGSHTVFSVIVNQLNSACMGTGTDSVYTFANPTLDTVLVTNLQDDIYDAFQHHSYYGQPAYDVCEGASIQITAYMKDASGNRYIDTNVTYKWRRNGVVIEGVNGYTFMEQLAILDHDQYKYVYTVEIDEPQYPNCYSVPTSVVSDTVKVRRNPIVIIGGQHYVCYQGPSVNNIVLQAWVDGSVDTGAIYRWYRDGQLEDNPYHSMYGAMFTGPFAPRYGFNYVFQVEVVNGSGCSSFSEPFEVTVMAPPVVNITPYTDTVCRGGEVMLVSHLDDYNVLDYELKYQWYANEISTENLIPGATEPFYNTNVDSTTNFIVDVRYLTENVNRPHCFARDTMTVNVYDRPEIDSIIMSLTEVCEGSQVQLTAVMDSVHQGVPNVPYIYEWYRNSELLPGNAATIYDAPMTVDGNEQQFTYSVKVYQNPERMMCESPIFVSSQTLTVFPNPIVAIFGDQHVCYTDTITLVANIDTISNPVSTNVHYYWFESGAPIDNLNGDSAVLSYYAPAQDEPYRFTVQVERDSSVTGCRSYSYEYDVWVYNAPVANVTIVDTAVCEGAEVTVTAHLNQNVPEQTNLEYQWYTKTASDTDYVLVPGATELTYTTTIFETTTFKFDVVHTLSGCFDVDSATINVYPIPVVDRVVMSDTNVCEGSDIIVTAILDSTVIGVPGYPYFYEWRRNGELLEGNTATIHDQPMTADGTTQTYVYSVIAYQTPERLACYSELVNSAELTVFGNPRVAIFGDQHVCYTDTISLVANVDTFAYPVGDLHYIWYESGNMITNLNGDDATLRYYAPAQDEPYRFTVQIERDNSEAACRSYSTEYDVWVYNAPVANVTIVDETVCEGAEVTVTAHLNQNVPEQTNLEYQWFTKTSSDTDYVLVPGATALTYTTIVNDTTEFMFRVVHTLSGCFDTDSKTINVNRIPYVNYVSMSDTNVCEGAQVTIYADIDSTRGVPGMPYFFEWRRNGELLAGNTQTIYDSPMTVDGNEQTFVYSVIAYQDPTRLACFSELVESATLNVFPNPRVAISGDQYVCETDSVFLYANVDTIGRPVGILHYTWYESGRLRDNMAYGLADSRYFSEYFYAQDEPYRFTVEVQRDDIAGGCRAYSEEFLVWVYKQPVVNITAEETEICRGGEILLRANLNNYEFNYANDAQYQWYTVDTVKDARHIAMDSAGNYIDSVIITVEHNPIPGATTLFYRTTLDSSAVFGFTATHNLSGCSDYDEIAITVNDIPVIVSVENLSGQDTLCPGGRVELHATVEGGVPGGEIYTWYRNGVQMESTGENLIDYPLAVDNDVTMYIYEVVVKQTAAGCESVIDSLSTDTIWVVPNPTIELSGDPIVCDTTDQNIVITANVVSYVDTTDYGYTYQWYENNAPIEGETGLVLSMHKPYRDYPYSFNFEVKNPYGCTVLSEPFLVYVNDNPIVHIAADDTLICENGTVTLTADLYDQNAENLVYVWYINGDSIPGAYNTTYTTTLTSTSTFTFKAFQRDSHCAAISNEVTVNVVPAPVVDSITVVSVDTAICEGHVVTLHANISGGDTTDTPVYTWYKDNEVVVGVTGETFTDYPMSVDNEITTHIYNVTVAQASSACFSLYDVNDEVTINVRPNPRYTIYGDADVCESDTVNIVLNGITNDSIIATAGDYTYTWYESGVVIDGQTTATLAINKPYRTEPYIFKLVVTDTQFGCTSETEDFLVYVSARPIVNVTSTEDTICTNGVVTLTANIYDQNAEYLAFQWYKNDTTAANMIAGANDPTYTTAVETTTEFFVVVNQLTTGCQTVASKTVKVNEIPVITSVENLSGQDTLCPGGRVELHATISGGVAGGEVYTWYRNGVQLESTGENLIDYPMAEDNNVAQYIYEVTVRQTAAACQSVITPASTDTLWIVPNPTIELAGDPIVCDTTANNIVITANVVSYLETPYTYQWYENNAPINGETGLTLSIHKDYRDYPYSFNFAVQNIYGCTVESEPFLVYVNDNPIVRISASETDICENGTVTLTANLYDLNADNLVYVWYKDNDSIPGAYNTTYTTTLDTTATFTFKAYQRDSHCAAISNELTINVAPIPVVDSITLLSEHDTICAGGRVELRANISGGVAGGEVYTWYRNGVELESTGNTVVDYPLTVDNTFATYVYEVVVRQTASACQSVITPASTHTILVAPNPTIELAGDAIVCEATGNNVTVNANVVYYVDTTNFGFTYQWYENNVAINGENGLVLSMNKPYRDYPYSFNFAVQNRFGCTVESEPFLVYVNDAPVVSIAADDTMICENGTVTLTANLYDLNADNMVYVWYKNGDSIPGAYNTTYTTSLDTTATFTFKAFQRNSHCEATSNPVTVTVVAAPSVDSITVVSNDVTICEGHVVELHANISGGDTNDEVTYTWYKDNEIVVGATGANFIDYPMSVDGDITTHIYNVTVAQTSDACYSLYDANTEIAVSVRPNPVYNIYGDADVCEEADTNITNINLVGITTDSVIGTNDDYTFTWYESGVEIAGQNTATLAINRPYRHEPYLFKLIVTDNVYGCTFETSEFAVTVDQRPVVVIAVDMDSICEGGNVTLTSTLMNQTEEGIIYQWQQDVNGTWANIEGAIAPIYVTPALTQTTTYRLHVTNTINGCESNSINDITVTVKPTPVIDIINVTADVVCDGGEVTLTATGADQYTGLGDVQYQWYKNGQAIFGADQNVYTTSPLTVDGNMTTYTFGVQVTMSNSGCVSNIDTATVTVYANPTVNITYNNGLTLCEGGVTTLTANPHHAYFTDFTYQWFLHGQPIPGATDSTYVVENLSASQNAYDYTVEITVNNGTQNGCSAVADPVYVTIVNDPTATITVNEGVNAICEGGTVTFTVTPNGGVEDTYNPYTYAWYSNIAGNGVVLGTEASFTTSADDAANLYVYYVDVTSAYGCNIRVSDTLRIVEDPTVTIAVKMGEDSVVCDGGHTTLIATVEGGLGTATYQWYKNGFAIAGATGNELVTDALYVNETAAYTVSVAQSGIACTATSTQFNVAVFEAIEVALSASSEVNCVGGSVTLTATTTNGIPGDMLTYQWFRNGNPINGATGSQYVTDENLVAGHYEYQVEVSSTISGCHVAQSGTIGITVEAEPTVMISSDVIGNAICEGGNITLTANVIYATNATQHNNTYTYTWKWYEGTTLMSVQTTDPHYTLPATMAAGSYNFFVEISSNDGLGCDASSQSNLFNVVIKPVPTVILTANADESCQGGDVTFNAVVIPSNLSGIYYWTVNGGTPIVTSNASITVNNMTVGTNNVSVVFAPNDAQVACNSATTTITHVVNAIPVVTVAATDPSRLSMCVGGTITIAATATGTANSSDRYVWTVDGQTQTGNTGSTFTTQLNTPGIHTFSAMVERAMGCNSDFSTPIAVTVAEQPTAQLTQTAGFTEMCAGGEITLMAKVPNYATVNNGVTNNSVHGTYTYTWFRDNAEFLTTPNVTVDNAQVTETLNVPAAYTYSVTISASGYNCQAAHATLDHQIRVVPDPSWSVNQVNPTELCIGGIVTLNAEVTGGVENQQAGRIQWYKTFNGVESEVAGLGGQNTDVPEAAGVYTYAPKYIDYIGAGCNIADATPTQVTVNDLPTARFTAGHGSVICGHDYQSFATLEITLTGTAPFTFTIMNMTTGESQTIVTSLSVYTYNVNPAVTSIYRIISVSDANGCIGTMDNVSDAVVSVSDVQIAAETVVASCEDWIARIPLQVNASTSTTFTATLPDGSQQTGNIMFDAYTQQHYVEVQMPAVAGDYIVTIEVDGCSGEVLVRVPASDASMGVTSTLVDQRWDDVVVVNNNPDNNGGYKFSTYQWYKNGEPINGATGQYYQEVGGLEGFYSVELDGIRVSDGAQVHFITCEKYFSAGSSIRVYPVPANTTQEVTIELNMTEEELEGAILDIYDVRGAHVKSLNNLTPITKVGNFGAQGTYFGRIITGTNEIKTVKFIIVK